VIADSEIWVPVHLVIVLGLVLMLGGLVALYQSIRGGTAGVLARFGLFAAVAGVTIGVADVLMDGVGAPQLAQEWAAAPAAQKATALSVVLANETINFALASGLNFIFAGVTFILFGLAVALSDVYPRWLGWVAFLAGLVSIGAGLVHSFVGEPTNASRILTIIGPTIITRWLLVIGIMMWRRGPRMVRSRTATEFVGGCSLQIAGVAERRSRSLRHGPTTSVLHRCSWRRRSVGPMAMTGHAVVIAGGGPTGLMLAGGWRWPE
jgi:hypothetical protein